MFLAALALAFGVPVQAQAATMPAPIPGVEWPNDLAVAPLMARRTDEAIAILEQSRLSDPEDPAVLINLGIAYAQSGREAEARALFNAALAKRVEFDLAISSGQVTDSRQLARRAIRMLDRGQFRTPATAANQFTLRN
ncbi:MAG: tetratricopeptide repeat protein [Erythrobacter sp.]